MGIFFHVSNSSVSAGVGQLSLGVEPVVLESRRAREAKSLANFRWDRIRRAAGSTIRWKKQRREDEWYNVILPDGAYLIQLWNQYGGVSGSQAVSCLLTLSDSLWCFWILLTFWRFHLLSCVSLSCPGKRAFPLLQCSKCMSNWLDFGTWKKFTKQLIRIELTYSPAGWHSTVWAVLRWQDFLFQEHMAYASKRLMKDREPVDPIIADSYWNKKGPPWGKRMAMALFKVTFEVICLVSSHGKIGKCIVASWKNTLSKVQSFGKHVISLSRLFPLPYSVIKYAWAV